MFISNEIFKPEFGNNYNAFSWNKTLFYSFNLKSTNEHKISIKQDNYIRHPLKFISWIIRVENVYYYRESIYKIKEFENILHLKSNVVRTMYFLI